MKISFLHLSIICFMLLNTLGCQPLVLIPEDGSLPQADSQLGVKDAPLVAAAELLQTQGIMAPDDVVELSLDESQNEAPPAFESLPVPIAPLVQIPDAQSQVIESEVQNELLQRMTLAARNVEPDSPYYRTTWLTYYGRPGVGVMGILGEYDIDTLTTLLHAEARNYDEANGPGIGVMPAFHLVYGMATREPGAGGDYLTFLTDETVMEYVERAAAEGFAVILDIQIGGLTPVESMRYGFPFLKYPNVHLAIDPEFALVHPNQVVPGNPIGYITAEDVNQVQAAMVQYLVTNGIRDRKIFLVHQFLDEMIRDKDNLDHSYPIDLTVSVDGWGGPAGKISKYNGFVDQNDEFSSFKLFFRWDVPVLTPAQALGIESYDGYWSIDVMPNMIIYQ